MRLPGTGVGVVLSLCVAGAAHAQGGYIGLNVGQLRLDRSGLPEAEIPVVEVRVGNRLNDYLALEARYGTGTADETVPVSGVPISVDVEHYYGLYLLASLPLASWLSIYGLGGVTAGEIELTSSGASTSGSDVDGSYGVGAELKVGRAGVIVLEWARLFDQGGYDVATVSAGLAIDF